MFQKDSEQIFKAFNRPKSRDLANLFNLSLKLRTQILLGFSSHVKIQIRPIFKCPLDQLRLSNAASTRYNRKSCRNIRFFTNLPQQRNLRLSIKELHRLLNSCLLNGGYYQTSGL